MTDPVTALIAAETAGWSPEQRAALAARLEREVARREANTRWPSAGQLAQACDPSTVQTPMLEQIDQDLEWALSTPDARLLITTPPQLGKSTRISMWCPVRALVQNPSRRIVLASYSETLARSHSRRARNLVYEHGAQARDAVTGMPLPDKLGLAVADDAKAATRWQIAGHQGGMFAVGVGGSLTGQPADVGLIDDPIRNMEDADSALIREKLIEWYQSVFLTRLAPGAPLILVQTRWHEQDLAGHVLAEDLKRAEGDQAWRVRNFPAISEEGIPDALGRAPGVVMETARGHTAADFARIREDVGERTWYALYQGQPTPAQGGLFDAADFARHRIEALPATAVRIVSIDPAETGRRDEAGLVALAGTTDGRVVVTDDRSGRMQSDVWARRAVLLALETGATEVLFEAYTTEQTYTRVLDAAWRDVRDQARLLHAHGADTAAQLLAAGEDPPADPIAAISELDGLTVPDQTDPPFRLHPWRGKGDKIARATGARQASSTGRLRMLGVQEVLERQASRWQPGQASPDRMDALVNGYERIMALIGSRGSVAVPGQAPAAAPSWLGGQMPSGL